MRVHAQQVGHRGRVNNGEHTSLNINFKMEENLFFSTCVNFRLQSCSSKKKKRKENRPKHWVSENEQIPSKLKKTSTPTSWFLRV